MSDNDLIRRGDARKAVNAVFNGYPNKASDAIAALPADPRVEKLVEALREAVYLLDPDEEDIAKETGLYRIVTTLAEIEGNPCPRRFISMEGRE
jgi:hypothetical protein